MNMQKSLDEFLNFYLNSPLTMMLAAFEGLKI